MSLILVPFFAFVACLGIAFLRHRRVDRRLAAVLARAPGLRRRLLAALGPPESSYRERSPELQRLLVLDPDADPASAVGRIGGEASLPAGAEPPKDDDGTPSALLVELSLEALPPPWSERQIAVFDADLFAGSTRSYLRSEVVPASTSGAIALVPVDMPSDDGTPTLRGFIEEHPDWRRTLAVPEDVEVEILRYALDGGRELEIEVSDSIRIGGAPSWIQGDPRPVCGACGASLRFLFSFGAVEPRIELGDAGVAYVHGCDDHPNEVVIEVQCS